MMQTYRTSHLLASVGTMASIGAATGFAGSFFTLFATGKINFFSHAKNSLYGGALLGALHYFYSLGKVSRDDRLAEGFALAAISDLTGTILKYFWDGSDVGLVEALSAGVLGVNALSHYCVGK